MASRDVRVAIVGDAAKLRKAVDDANESLGGLGRVVGGLGGLVKTAGVGLLALGGSMAGAAMAAKPLIDAASDLNESISKVGVIFGEQAKPIQDFAATAAKRLGMSRKAALDAASTMATFGKAAGLSGSELTDFSTSMVNLSSDLASFFNTNPDEAMQAIAAALRGESEPIRKYGVLLDDATLRQRAFEMGLIDSTKNALTPQQKALAAQAEILAQTKDAQGDFARTADGAANKQRILAASVEDLKAKLGQALLPTFQKLLGFMIDKVVPAIEQYVVPAMGTLAGYVESHVVPALEAAVAWVRTNWPTIQSVIVTVVDAIRTAIEFYVNEVVPRLIDAWTAIIEFVQTNWPKVQAVIEAVIKAVSTAIGAIVAYVEEHWPSIEETIGDVVDNVRAVIEAFVTVVQALWETFGDTILGYAEGVWNGIRTVIEGALNIIKGALDIFIGAISLDWDRVFDGFESTAEGTFKILEGIVGLGINTLKTALRIGLDAITTIFATPFNAAKDAVLDIFGKIVDGFRTAVNYLIDKWNSIEFTLPSVDTPFGTIGGGKIGVPKIPRLADGGIVTRPTVAMIGERGAEAIVPLDRYRSTTGGSVTINLPPGVDGDDVVGAQQRWARRNGGLAVA